MRTHATGRVLHDPKGGSFWFDAGAVCLDFAHSGGEGRYAVFETLHEPADLGAWLASPPLGVTLTAPVTARELTAAKALRQAIWEAAHAQAAGTRLAAATLTTLNAAAAAPPLVPMLLTDTDTAAPDGLAADGPGALGPGTQGTGTPEPGALGPGAGGLTAGWATPARATQALSTLAREMIDLLTGPLAGRFRECAGDNCPLVFVDSSRPGSRRWCAMERCGNRHKLRAHRARRAQSD